MKSKLEKCEPLMRGIIYLAFTVFALVASFVPGGLAWTAVVGLLLTIGFGCTLLDSLHQEQLLQVGRPAFRH